MHRAGLDDRTAKGGATTSFLCCAASSPTHAPNLHISAQEEAGPFNKIRVNAISGRVEIYADGTKSDHGSPRSSTSWMAC